jgi:proteasome lid subunit RPN8/RPN11
MLHLDQRTLDGIIAHARGELPFEACGYLAQKDGVVCTFLVMTNTDKAADHFSMDPAEQFAAVKTMRAGGEKLRAVYHSHPETPARPSAEDIRLAFDPQVSHVIISLADPENVEVKSYRILNGEVFPEPITVVADL